MAELIGIAKTYAQSAPGANTNIFSTSLKPQYPASVFRITVCLTTASVLNLMTTDGTTAYANGLYNSVALAAGDLYTFSFGVRKYSTGTTELTYNFQVETDSVIRILYVEELNSAVI